MKKQSIYLDTSTISLLDQEDSPERMEASKKLWEEFKDNNYDVFISEETLREVKNCLPDKSQRLLNHLEVIKPILINLNSDILDLAEKIRDLQILPPSSVSDSIHLAAALIKNCDYLVSWNFKHLVNPRAKNGIAKLKKQLGFKQLEIISPFEIIESETL